MATRYLDAVDYNLYMKNLSIILVLLFSVNLYAKVQVKVLKGDVTFNGTKVTKESDLSMGGSVEVGDKSFLKIFSDVNNSSIVIGPNSKLDIKFEKKKLPFSLLNGVARWVTEGQGKLKGGIKTRNAIMGVRGTDFMIIANWKLAETEVICFDGQVKIFNRENRKDTGLINKGQWGGLGGRFGDSVGKVLDLPERFVEVSKQMLPMNPSSL